MTVQDLFNALLHIDNDAKVVTLDLYAEALCDITGVKVRDDGRVELLT